MDTFIATTKTTDFKHGNVVMDMSLNVLHLMCAGVGGHQNILISVSLNSKNSQKLKDVNLNQNVLLCATMQK